MSGWRSRVGGLVAGLGALAVLASRPAAEQSPRVEQTPARITESVRVLETYGFSEPNPVPILTRDPRLYPYHSFDGYEAESSPREWTVVHLENDLIELWVLPEIGGKVWGARVKATGHEFIYRNEVVKFRNIALRGPWTSGGIEFNFGVIGHTPATATPVDYLLRENPDGSVSCFVGTTDLPSRTEWRVEIRLPADKAYFETNALWHNPTPLEQPYYNWMTAAAFARDDLVMTIPGDTYLQHSGAPEDWPVDPDGRNLARYAENAFGGNKSFHVVGEMNDFFGGYYHDDDYGFGHWARYEDMPGQKLWVWALSRAGGIWEDLLTDTDGQYVEFQAGRQLVQYSPGADVNPITKATFEPYATDQWSETWFPVEGIGGLSDASRDGAMSVREEDGQLVVGVNAFGQTSDALRVWIGDRLVLDQEVELAPLEPFVTRVDLPAGARYRVALPALDLDYDSDPAPRRLSRPFDTDDDARPAIPRVDRLVFEARELVKARRYADARPLFAEALEAEPWNRDALLALADLEYRRALYEAGLVYARRALQLDAYDAEANFIAGNLYRALGQPTDAREAFGWAARSPAYRSAAYVQLAELSLASADRDAAADRVASARMANRRTALSEAERYARLALDYDRASLQALEVLALTGRLTDDSALTREATSRLLAIDPLTQFVAAEQLIAQPTNATAASWWGSLRSEYPEQTLLELMLRYRAHGLWGDADLLNAPWALPTPLDLSSSPLLRASSRRPEYLDGPIDVDFVFPYRRETLPALEWATRERDRWEWRYLYALNLWALDRADEAYEVFVQLGNEPTVAATYVARAHLVAVNGGDPEPDLRRAVALEPADRTIHIPLIRFLQDQARWADALAAIGAARERFPDDFNLHLFQARSLVHLERPGEAIAILDATHVLPSEHARESHRLYEQAHTMAALDAMETGRVDDARSHLEAALEWPEHLGQGRPYDPEERLVRYLLAIVLARTGQSEAAGREWTAVVDATRPANPSRLDALGLVAAARLGRLDDLAPRAVERAGALDAGNPTRRLLEALASGDRPPSDVAAEYPAVFSGLDGRLLLRALGLGTN